MTSRRDRQAEQTRRDILDAARRLFARNGYRGTTVSQIAAEADVAVQTIYDSLGSKAAIVSALNDRIDDAAGIADIARRIPEIDDPTALVGIPIAITRRILETSGDIARTAFRGSSEPELAAIRAEGIRRHRGGLQGIARRLEALDALAPGLTVDRAADVMALLCDPETWLTWTDDYGWSVDDVSAWTTDSITRLVLASR